MKLKIEIQLIKNLAGKSAESEELAPIDPRKVLVFFVLLVIPAIFLAFYIFTAQTKPILSTPAQPLVTQLEEPVKPRSNKPQELRIKHEAA